jgi:hypothetical protein
VPGLDDLFIEKAIATLEGAKSEQGAPRYDYVANRRYARFQAPIAALEGEGVRPEQRRKWALDS